MLTPSLLRFDPFTFAHLQGAQAVFNELPCEYVEPHELKEFSKTGGKGRREDLISHCFKKSLCWYFITISRYHLSLTLLISSLLVRPEESVWDGVKSPSSSCQENRWCV